MPIWRHRKKLLKNPKVDVLLLSEPRAFEKVGDKMKTTYQDLKTGESKSIISDGVFVFVGMKPNIDLFGNQLQLDSWGYIQTDDDMKTSFDGVYAVGDVISKKYRQITTAVADGTIASIAISGS
ncbi:MAG: FAD-dependent oxidoreductase [Bacteroidales bacterium]|nr:FAD-dependent oxidoreductase [Bacteroidales bacterium]